ncbi:2-phospho-L-lactate transferase [Methylobacterium sp. NEAU 140]|uniref:2-phospho-L-lactate transferase n=1 Tax=Methylobacterium sp. NEAU 140 TaxID=3064945 RepID=UPI002736DD2B|nr:2-phospho-L-lactate transferase [Methylobacterium sp. NEAU 140]MDP4021998.1 2-phospho-L-lactate transferase [Methylobacterium sp. NEAU 140]
MIDDSPDGSVPGGDATYIALCGGVGGSKLAAGLQALLGRRLTVVVNVGDDFDHLGLRICPDIDTVLYRLSGLNDEQRGWGRADESWQFMRALGQFSEETWFQLGDLDVALHVVRTHRQAAGYALAEITMDMADRLGIDARVVPATDDAVRTKVVCQEGVLDFQRYFVERRCEPPIERLVFEGAADARPTPAAEAAFAADSLAGIVICPSNPYLSIDPILAIPRLRALLAERRVPAVAVSPIIDGKAVKGPTAKIMRELNVASTPHSIALHYEGLIDGLMIDTMDASRQAEDCGVPVCSAATLMTSAEDQVALAGAAIDFMRRIAGTMV